MSDSWWKLDFGVAPDFDSCSIMRRDQATARPASGREFPAHVLSVHHVGKVGLDLVVQRLGRMSQQVALLDRVAPLG